MIARTRAQVLLPILLFSTLLIIPSFGIPIRKVEECLSKCKESFFYHQDRQLLEKCEQICFDKYDGSHGEGIEKKEGEQQRGEGQNRYCYGEENFEYWMKSELGHFKVLERFTERFKLLQGIGNFRLAILEANPRTFVLPSHMDAEELFYVMEGRGVLNVLEISGRNSYDIEQGQIFSFDAGSQAYLINKDDNKKLRIAMLLHPVSSPGRFKEFFDAGGRAPESFYRSFSTKVLEAAFNTTKDRLEKLFGQQRGETINATEEQIKALTEPPTAPGGWFIGPSKQCRRSGVSLTSRQNRVWYSNEHGELYKIYACDYSDLCDLGVEISFANISRGSMMAPHYNSMATLAALVVEGEGYFEMACPHIEQGGTHYQAVRSQVSPGSVFMIPAGHPVVAVASRDENLQVLFLGMNAKHNRVHFLAGGNNVLNHMERVAKELSFNAPARVVDEVFNAQKRAGFLPGPDEIHKEERGTRPWTAI
ncbi:vicilin Cor a 11.0101 [Elaeis guineensis]|uniref:Globulin-1 S allele n=1 Tax=Elaeis guineensis var. tenera TaxID=51953 RepID=A0A6I9S6X6_ELAGV|nr:globulin-1 S allele [Elaeis guineensis]